MSIAVNTHEVVEQFANTDDVSIDADAIEQRLDVLITEYDVPPVEAKRSVVNGILDDHDIDRAAFYGEQSASGNDHVGCGEIDTDEQWIDLTITVSQLWEPNSDAIAQVGLLGDESGQIKFVSFTTSELPALEEGASYRLENVVTDEYEGRYSVKLNRTTEITPLDEPVAVSDDATSITGALVAIQAGSGLIKRCPEEDCTRVVQDGRCSEHGAVDGEFDLRIKGVLDDGSDTQAVLFDQDATEALTGISLDEATELAMDALDTTVVADQMCDTVVGRYYEVTGPEVGRYILVHDANEQSAPAASETAAQLDAIDWS